MARILHWNGKDVPNELRELPPGEYVLEPLIRDAPPLTAEEEEGIRRALASRGTGRVVSHEEVTRSIDDVLKR
jgi:predicted transcriptional regulator